MKPGELCVIVDTNPMTWNSSQLLELLNHLCAFYKSYELMSTQNQFSIVTDRIHTIANLEQLQSVFQNSLMKGLLSI